MLSPSHLSLFSCVSWCHKGQAFYSLLFSVPLTTISVLTNSQVVMLKVLFYSLACCKDYCVSLCKVIFFPLYMTMAQNQFSFLSPAQQLFHKPPWLQCRLFSTAKPLASLLLSGKPPLGFWGARTTHFPYFVFDILLEHSQRVCI